jgi:hypothetical protein
MAGTLAETKAIWCLGDFKKNMPTATGGTVLVHRVANRLVTPFGRVPWWPNYGFDVRAALLSNMAPSRVTARAIQECEKEENVRADCVIEIVTSDRFTRRWILTVTLFLESETFTFTMTISEAAQTLIALQKAA